MKKPILPGIILLLFLYIGYQPVSAQCPGGYVPGATYFDTTIVFPTGTNSTVVGFPKFDPQQAMLTCVRLIITITGIVDSVAMQNFSSSTQTANFYYNRTDSMSGPGLTPPLTNSYNGLFGPYSLSPYDGIPGAGSDFRSISRDTVLQQVMVRTLTDSTAISQFYGLDTLYYNYAINVTTSAVITGGSSSSLVLTSALVNFRLEYCTCPNHVLPLYLKEFTVHKRAAAVAALKWKVMDDDKNYVYEIQVMKPGQAFETVGLASRSSLTGLNTYLFDYSIEQDETLYFRICRKEADGKLKYSPVRILKPSGGSGAQLQVFPNPARGVVHVKPINAGNQTCMVIISNSQGQEIRRFRVAGNESRLVEGLSAGIYFVSFLDADARLLDKQKLLVY